MSNTLFVIGYMSGMSCYLNVSQEEAERRYRLENPDAEGYDIKKVTFDDMFEAYSIYGGENVESVFSAENLRNEAEANNWDTDFFIFEKERLLKYLEDQKRDDKYEVKIKDAADYMGISVGDVLVLADDMKEHLNINVAIGNSGGSYDLEAPEQTLELY